MKFQCEALTRSRELHYLAQCSRAAKVERDERPVCKQHAKVETVRYA
jgi:hypothetical protein